jgi:hypothetical protein
VELPEIAFSEWLLLSMLELACEDPVGISPCKDSFKTLTRLIFYSSTSFLYVYPTKFMSFLYLFFLSSPPAAFVDEAPPLLVVA